MMYSGILKTIDFNKNYNNKLDCECFTTIRINDPKKKYIPGETVNVRLNRNFRCQATIMSNLIYKLSQLDYVITYLDAAMNNDNFYNLMESIYKDHCLWKGKDTDVCVVLFIKKY